MSRVRYWIATTKNGSECRDVVDVDTEEWESMCDAEKESYMRELAFDRIEWGYEEVGTADSASGSTYEA